MKKHNNGNIIVERTRNVGKPRQEITVIPKEENKASRIKSSKINT